MPKSEASISITAPIEEVFNAVADQEKAAQWYPAAKLISTKGKPDELESSAELDYLILGMKIRSAITVIEVNKPNKIVHRLSGMTPGQWTWTLQEEGQIVKVNFRIDYNVPWGILGKITNRLFLGRMNQRNMEKSVHNLKSYCET